MGRSPDQTTRSSQACSHSTRSRWSAYQAKGWNQYKAIAKRPSSWNPASSRSTWAVPRTIARVNNPKNEELFKHLGVDELISPTRMILGSIEQDIPVHELLHLAALGEGELELIEAHLQAGSPAIGRAPRDIPVPEGCSLFAVVRDGVATPLRQDTILAEGDKVIAIGKGDCQAILHEQLIGDTAGAAAG